MMFWHAVWQCAEIAQLLIGSYHNKPTQNKVTQTKQESKQESKHRPHPATQDSTIVDTIVDQIPTQPHRLIPSLTSGSHQEAAGTITSSNTPSTTTGATSSIHGSSISGSSKKPIAASSSSSSSKGKEAASSADVAPSSNSNSNSTQSNSNNSNNDSNSNILQRRSRRSRKPIIAPGFGTAEDLERLASELGGGLTTEVVTEVMASQGRGIRRTRRSAAADDEASAAASAPTSNAWASFMEEEGVDGANASSMDHASSTRGSASAGGGTGNGMAAEEDHDDNDYDYDLTTLQLASLGAAKPAASASRPAKKAKTAKAFGTLVHIGTLDSTAVGRKPKGFKVNDITNPTMLKIPTVLLPKIAITNVIASVSGAHAMAIDSARQIYGWGRNELDQLTSSLPKPTVPTPTLLPGVTKPVVAAAVGKSHSVLLHADGTLSAVGSNKVGQCGMRESMDSVRSFKPPIVPDGVLMARISCGEDFTMALDTDGKLYSAGSSEFGQLGNGETGEYFVAANKLAFVNSYRFVRRSVFHYEEPGSASASSRNKVVAKTVQIPKSSEIRLSEIGCGRHHTLAVEAPRVKVVDGETDATKTLPPRVFTWGSGNYGCLGHGRQADEYFPRMIQLPGYLPGLRVAKVFAGTSCSLLITDSDTDDPHISGGHVYYWGKHRSNQEAAMRPTVVNELANNGHVVTHVGCASTMVAATTTLGDTVVWGQGIAGEFHMTSDDDNQTTKRQASSSRPTFCMQNRKCLDLTCGQGSLIAVVEDETGLPVVDTKAVYERLGVDMPE